MDYFVSQMLNDALKQVKSNDDASSLAHAVLQLSERKEEDCLWANAEHRVLTAMIEETSKTASKDNFSNIFAMIQGDFESLLNGNQDWLEFKDSTTEHFRRCAVTGLETRLGSLRLYS